jgi:hypothetical protein
MKFSRSLSIIFFAGLLNTSCVRHVKEAINETDLLHQNEDKLTKMIIYDVFTPPVASRIYAYASLASYEAIRYQDPAYFSIVAKLKGFGTPPAPQKGKKYNFALAATKAFFTVTRKVTFSVDSLKAYENNVYGNFKNTLDDSTYERSIAFGDAIGKFVLKRANNDNYLSTRSKPKFLGSDAPGKWRPTAPDYMDGVEYCWGTMKTFAIDSSGQFPLTPPPSFSEDKNSAYMKEADEVYNTSKNLTNEQLAIAKFWDDNPFVVEHAGHMTFANKKITPGGHWIGITTIACKKTHANSVKTAQAYALTSVAMYDAFICCWNEKYKTNYIRPITVINQKIDNQWLPLLQTPPFPEYPSGHSTITRSAAVMLTKLFGDNISFQDTSDLHYIGMQRHFNSFVEAANEASISRFYGGIHYLNSVNRGADEGLAVSNYIIKKLDIKRY